MEPTTQPKGLTAGTTSKGVVYAVPQRAIVMFDDGSQSELALSFKVNDNGSHVFSHNGRTQRQMAEGYQVSLTITKVASGDPKRLAAAKLKRLDAQRAKLAAVVALDAAPAKPATPEAEAEEQASP